MYLALCPINCLYQVWFDGIFIRISALSAPSISRSRLNQVMIDNGRQLVIFAKRSLLAVTTSSQVEITL